ncbi:PQQ-dependent sugar dehydrogenase [Flavobacterium selenitireducens]|uniref:PQQ-dependent sugar dehydrogenase n=1 Tax=Flavobacterium selenitireducens TaxID=2722704 RepID=UPI00168B7871|nr:PQQ-dependent sugar dehydrogenase [Flavobacterium selenitireducens]MBD3581710.1 glucose dehydrogenase [Flavobacterium selenitireducens]
MKYLLLLIACVSVAAQKGIPPKEVVNATITTKYAQPMPFKPELVSQLKAPAGYEVIATASGLGKPRMLYAAPNDRLYITRRDAGDVLMLSEPKPDGTFANLTTAVSDFKGVHGITMKDGWLFLLNNNELRRYKLLADGTADMESKQTLINDLPSGGQHSNRTMDFGPDGMLYLTVGSVCNDCVGDKETATVLWVDPKTWQRGIYASGLRNTIGIDWHPKTGELWGLDNGSDYKGDNWPPEELNKLVNGADYGFPFGYGKREIDKTREDPGGTTKEEVVAASQPSVMEFPAHAAPIAFQFFTSGGFNGDGLVCWHGSWNRSEPDGFKVERIKFKDGQPVSSEDFLSGFYLKAANQQFGRPTGLVITANGTVFVSDDSNGVIYRIQPKK